MCHGHYLRVLRRGDPQPERPLTRGVIRRCTASDDCQERIYAKGLCRIHYRRWRRTGDVQADRPIRARSLEGFVNHGYRYVRVPVVLRHLTDGATTCAEHRLVMAALLGRPLRADESVHHRDGDRLNNRPDNLELWSRWQPSGQRVDDKLKAARDLLSRYAPTFLADKD